MSRRGLVSKEPPSQGGPAVMAKGGKPPAATALAIEEVATKLRVEPSQILEWMRINKLRGNSSGVRPYDLRKFELDYSNDIREAQAKALAEGQKMVKKSSSKQGFFSRLFKSKATSEGAPNKNLIQENALLREELNRARQNKDSSTSNVQLEDKIKYLEGRLAKASALEKEVARLKQELATSKSIQTPASAISERDQELASIRSELNIARQAARANETMQISVVKLESERNELKSQLHLTKQMEAECEQLKVQLGQYKQLAQEATLKHEQLKEQLNQDQETSQQKIADYEQLKEKLEQYQQLAKQAESEKEQLKTKLAQEQQLLAQIDSERESLKIKLDTLDQTKPENDATASQLDRLQKGLQETKHKLEEKTLQEQKYNNQRMALQQELSSLRQGFQAQQAEGSKLKHLLEELLNLQEINLERYSKLHQEHELALKELADTPSSEPAPEGDTGLKQEIESLKEEHQRLEKSFADSQASYQKLLLEQEKANALIAKLRDENVALEEFEQNKKSIEQWKVRVEELEAELEKNTSSRLDIEEMETEMRLLRKTLQSREAQVQKVALRFQENERALQKALKESTRLTELLIQREKSLNELRTEYEQEYREKMDGLDRQVSGLQWKLSLREERISSLENEVSQLKRHK